jgi:hypothetical protein
MKVIQILMINVLLTGSSACGIGDHQKGTVKGYDLKSPDERIVLPKSLNEISGITLTAPSTLACIEDEDGILFTYDFSRKEIAGKIQFWSRGDFEGIANVNDTIYVLRSDGFIFEISGNAPDAPKVTIIPTGITPCDNEGLCYDSHGRRLLMTCKEYTGKGSAHGRKRVLFGFDLKTLKLSDKPVYRFDLQDIISLAEKHDMHFATEPKKGKHDGEDILRFHPSDIAISPLTGDIYILSAVDHTLGVFNKEGRIRDFVILDPALFNQPEGILFLQNGDMLVSNEGGSGHATILRFNLRR